MSTTKWHGGKGSQTRKVNSKKFDENWERIFKKQEDAVPKKMEK
mgnify:FL=1|jgi:hypothetical protein